jgi:hypothetical protein
MKKSDSCGCENAEQSDRSSECGTSLTESPVRKPADEPKSHAWLEWFWISLRYVGTAVILALLYLLSYGPVDHHYNSKVTTQATGPNTFMITIPMRPAWVEIFYRRAFYLRMRSDLYNRYISRWNRDDSNGLIL